MHINTGFRSRLIEPFASFRSVSGKDIMAKNQDEALTERHLALFGAVLQSFARYEQTIEQAIAGVLRTEVSSIAILMRQLDFMAKRLAFLDLLRERSIPSDRWERIFAHLAVPTYHVGLRNHIAHSTWKVSPEPKSIQPDWILRWVPGIEPTFREPASDVASYTFESLSETSANLAIGHERFVACLIELGLISHEHE
ncbi:hypothetical protein [Bradyrhizobium sp. dw_411]|uniref:hypothetical protein n=1 Tax=Bradyrhizobium sp. dw_411 TaxID=2720082 RepID=UPI001BCC6D46|nr:hypothetical protein [Bradyrhizobium sp. dw_411]